MVACRRGVPRGSCGGGGGGAVSPVQTSTSPSSSTARRWASMSSVFRSSRAVLIELELAFEGPIGHAAPALEHGQRVVHNLLERHGRSSNPLVRVPRPRHVRRDGVSRGCAARVYQDEEGVGGKLPRAAGTLAWPRSGRRRQRASTQAMVGRPRSPAWATPLHGDPTFLLTTAEHKPKRTPLRLVCC